MRIIRYPIVILEFKNDKIITLIAIKFFRTYLKHCTAPQKLDIKNLTFGVFFNEINL